jgi:hypothetical protein
MYLHMYARTNLGLEDLVGLFVELRAIGLVRRLDLARVSGAFEERCHKETRPHLHT